MSERDHKKADREFRSVCKKLGDLSDVEIPNSGGILTYKQLGSELNQVLTEVRTAALEGRRKRIPLGGHPLTSYSGRILWDWLAGQRNIVWVANCVEAWSNNTLTASCDLSEIAGGLVLHPPEVPA